MNLAIAPFALALATALALLFPGRAHVTRRVIGIGSGLLQFALAAWLLVATWDGHMFVLHVGGWRPPLGITLVVDPLAAVMLTLTALTATAAIAADFLQRRASLEHPLRLPLVHFLLAGLNLAFSTGDLFNLFVALELVLVASYGLLTLEADNQSMRHAFPYVVVNILGGALFLATTAVAYGLFGSLNFAEISRSAAAMPAEGRLSLFAFMVIAVFGLKAGIVPLFFWLPNSYPVLPYPLAALFAGTLTKVGAYGLFRMFGTVLPHELAHAHLLLAWLAAATLLCGVLGALSREHVRGILSFQIVSHIGFIVLALGLFTPLSISAGVFYLIHEIVAKASLFIAAGALVRITGSDALESPRPGAAPAAWLGGIFLVQSLSLAGLPPLSGFWGKLGILTAALDQGAGILAVCVLLASLLTLVAMLRIWLPVFRPSRGESREYESARVDWRAKGMGAIAGALVLLSLGMGVGAEAVVRLSRTAGATLLDQHAYRAAVLGQSVSDNQLHAP